MQTFNPFVIPSGLWLMDELGVYLIQPLTERQAAALEQVQQAAAAGVYLSRSATDTATLDTITVFTTYNPTGV